MSRVDNYSETELMHKFDNKESCAFSAVYDHLYKPLYYFTSNLYRDTSIDPNDVIHDTFMMVWESKRLKFENIVSLKTYLYIAIKNKFVNYLVHKKCEDRYSQRVKTEYSERSLTSEIVEVEALSIINEALKILPQECAKVFELHINGWSVRDIAQQLEKGQCTVYTQRQDAITILKKKLSKEKLEFILFLLNW